MTQIICLDRGPEHPEPVVTIQGEKPSTLNVMREEALGEPRRKSLEGFPLAVLSKLGLKNEPGKREKWKNSRQRKVYVERALNMVQPGHCSAFLNSGLIVCETKRTVCTSQGQAFIQSFKECPENYEARSREVPGTPKSTRQTPALNARTMAVWRRGPDYPGAPQGG